jgi:hypothetical protein
MYYIAYPELENCYTLVNETAYKKHRVLQLFSCLISTPKLEETKGKGTVKTIALKLNKLDKYALLISPKGTVKKQDWRTGWFHLAKELDCKMICGGVDYDEHTIKVSDIIDVTDIESTRNTVLEKLTDVVPLYPENEHHLCRAHGPTSLVSSESKILFSCLSLIFISYLLM